MPDVGAGRGTPPGTLVRYDGRRTSSPSHPPSRMPVSGQHPTAPAHCERGTTNEKTSRIAPRLATATLPGILLAHAVSLRSDHRARPRTSVRRGARVEGNTATTR